MAHTTGKRHQSSLKDIFPVSYWDAFEKELDEAVKELNALNKKPQAADSRRCQALKSKIENALDDMTQHDLFDMLEKTVKTLDERKTGKTGQFNGDRYVNLNRNRGELVWFAAMLDEELLKTLVKRKDVSVLTEGGVTAFISAVANLNSGVVKTFLSHPDADKLVGELTYNRMDKLREDARTGYDGAKAMLRRIEKAFEKRAAAQSGAAKPASKPQRKTP